ncbi:kinase family with leucine-rich repeat domain-containing protein [Actinidia rufa]|uniref:Kinase family with leucine-rich repeat domain-containing protein n=1 Tax=Actinidia rufa TaxID=165716 RepID=A0A7J0GCL4_9ERIC|nr:kinase family with leucine-rich repeat domain-containing protein [Actinidia rufa]
MFKIPLYFAHFLFTLMPLYATLRGPRRGTPRLIHATGRRSVAPETLSLTSSSATKASLEKYHRPSATSKSLTFLDLSYNEISGGFPTVLYNCSNLQHLDLSQNYFVGPIPSDINRLSSSLQFIDIGANNFSGDIPPVIGDLPELRNLYLYANEFNGTFPVEIGNLTNLRYLKMAYNDLFLPAKVPSEFGKLKNLKFLWMTSCNLIGEIPDTLSNIFGLEHLDLSRNNLQGPIPKGLFQLTNLSIVYLYRNQLSGEIPTPIKSLGLTIFDLSMNNLTGQIPDDFGKLQHLELLSLFSNQFSGEIPPSLRVTTLDLSSNNLTGKIPDKFDNLAYEHSFRNNTNLCATNPISTLRNCFAKTRDSNHLSASILAVILVFAVVLYIAIVSLTFFMVRQCKKKVKTDSVDWKLTPFQKINFTEAVILSGLNESNLIGSGGSGKIYRIAVNNSGDFVAVKRIWNNKKSDHRLEKEFLAETEILGAIKHSNLVKLMCCISSEDSKLLVYEYMENQSLDKWLHGKNWRERELLSASSGSIDVYSFGVVLLELVTGREPNDGDEHTSLAEWAWRKHGEGMSIVDALDKDIKEPLNLEEKTIVFRLGLFCTSTLPSSRPSMRESSYGSRGISKKYGQGKQQLHRGTQSKHMVTWRIRSGTGAQGDALRCVQKSGQT